MSQKLHFVTLLIWSAWAVEVLPAIACGGPSSAADRETQASGWVLREADDIWIEPVSGIELVYLPAGSFLMGTPAGEPGRESGEVLHPVVITRPFYMGRFEVTQGQWEAVMGSQPSHFSECGVDCPVEGVNY